MGQAEPIVVPDRLNMATWFLDARMAEGRGEQVAVHVRPLKLDERVLVVEVDDPAWATQVKFLTPTIIERLRDIAEVDVDRVEVRVDHRNARGAKYEH